jgi:type VI protein secretion system component VasA
LVWSLRYALSRPATRVEIWNNGKWTDSNLSFAVPELPCYTTETDFASSLAKARDFLCSDARFRFVDLQGLRLRPHPAKHPLRLRVRLQGPLPRGMARGVNTSTFRLNAGVVVNRSPEPLQGQTWDHTQTELPIRPLGAGHREVLEVCSVRGIDVAPPHGQTSYRKYSTHAWGKSQGVFHVAKRRNSKGRMQTFLGLGYPDLTQELTCQNLAIDGVCGDGDYPFQHVPADKIAVSGKGVPPRIAVKGVVRPSPSYRMREHGSVSSIVFTLMQGHNHGWMDAERLKDGLRHVLWDQAETKRNLVETIRSVAVDNTYTQIKGVYWRLMDVEMHLRDTTCTNDTWDRLGQLEAFASVLWCFVKDETPIGSRGRLRLHVEPAGATFEYGDSE